MRYEDSMKGVAAQIIKEQQRASKIKNNPEEFHWHDEYTTLNFFRFICENIGNLGNGEIEKMVTRLKSIDQKKTEIVLFDTDLIDFTDDDFVCGEARSEEHTSELQSQR